MSNFNCPKCGSEHVQRLEVIYEQGTQNINTTSTSVGSGGGFGSGGFVGGAGSATTTTSGKAQTAAAKKAAPPVRLPEFSLILPLSFLVFIAIPAVAAIIGGAFLNSDITSVIIGVVSIAVVGRLFLKRFQSNKAYNKNSYPALYQQWLNSWMCNKCGSVYEQG